ncbi:MAG: YicC family protein [Candidatus Jettenia sp.]|uniref:YicC family protein n=1 Tax=Candidatus Jettenia caeni TaxID=247490 RepID=I3IN60_9BACT|nr:YicC/YloC family endoribonuclease [Candidatus Jettenia sp. AMX1]MBC6928039.1 YicC family protein [Candidatus Jettenia sp.]NUN23873.1 YicC family protein [Candidatus Jettenia caeni]KAA0251139.1 MAG: YicC family protein [Candidatus Jettenia sp. AMX1]MCE7879322.1 YicC family protein [Candidatus Jettenia sp. AMX1]MCQ3927454.1 YicC family protein [Candidatus Jettenia sp.]
MLKSMTGFGSAEYKDDACMMHIEIRSVNNRFLKIDSRLPDVLQTFENEIERPIREKIVRGTVLLNINYHSLKQESEYILNTDKLREYHKLLNDIKKEMGSRERVSINSLMLLPGIFLKGKKSPENADNILSLSVTLLNQALDKMLEMRAIEGKNLAKDIEQRKEFILSMLQKIEMRAPAVAQEYSKRLKNRAASLLAGTDIELTDSNLYREIAIFAERCDITEEINRLKSHLNQLHETLCSDEPTGRKIDFIVQEMFRETNTMCSKANDSILLKDLVDVKTEIEKIREQAFNIE